MASRKNERFGSTIGAYAAGFVPLPLAATGWLMYDANNSVASGNTNVFWVLMAAVPAALLLGPLNTLRTLKALGDEHAVQTAKLCAVFGLLGLVLMVLPFGLLLFLGWIGLVVDVALVGVTVPSMARQLMLSRLETQKMAQRARLGRA
jgi:hypothetical protein